MSGTAEDPPPAGAGPSSYTLADDDPRLGPPTRVTETPVDPQLALLPTHEMEWPDFERLLVRVAREVQGLRSVRLFGNPGQAQYGLDAVGLNAQNEVEGVQGKKYASFNVSDLDAAVTKFVDGPMSAEVRRLAIGVSCRANEREVSTRLVRLNVEHAPIEFELWDRDRLSAMLRDRPDIVIEFFGAATAARFCVPHEITHVQVPGPDAVSTADAVMLGPEASGETKAELAVADRLRANDPAAALVHLQLAKTSLTEAGFPAHAEVLDKQVVELLTRLGRTGDAARLLLDGVWIALEADREMEARGTARELRELAKSVSDDAADPTPAAAEMAETAIRVYAHPLGELPDLAELFTSGPSALDRARLILLAAEVALADGQFSPFAGHIGRIAALTDEVPADHEDIALRLKLLVAEATGKWGDLLHQARTRKLDRSLSALVLARHARHQALHGRYETADQAWTEAIEQACLAGRHEDAADWLYSRRQLNSRYKGLVEDTFHPLAVALNSRPGLPRVATGATRTRERALEALQADRPREAALRLRRHLRDAIVSGSWNDEADARILLAGLYRTVGEPHRAARHLILAGEAKKVAEVGAEVGDTYLDVREHLRAPTYWTAASAYRVVAAQADLLPDEHVNEIAEEALAVLERARSGSLVDTPFFGPSLYSAAHEALAAAASRLDESQAGRLLDFLEPLAPAKEGRYRRTDDSHAAACAGIGETHPRLLPRALDQLLVLMARESHALKTPALDLIGANLGLAEERLADLAAKGNRVAAELLAYAQPETIDSSQAEAAAQSLLAPLSSGPGHYSGGTSAVEDSVVARALTPGRRGTLVRAQLGRVRSPYEGALNRTEYLLAAANLVDDLPDIDARELFARAIHEAAAPARSEADELTQMYSHPLGAMRFGIGGDSRPAAVYLAARLARTEEQRRQVRQAALQLIGSDGDADFHVTQALRALGDDLESDVPWLARQGWALRSLAGIIWADSSSLPSSIGEALAADSDARVRRTLADALARRGPTDRAAAARGRLASDPRFSVRRLVAPTS